MSKVIWHNQEVLFETHLPRGFGKGRAYFMMKDTDGTHYLAKIDENGNPDLT